MIRFCAIPLLLAQICASLLLLPPDHVSARSVAPAIPVWIDSDTGVDDAFAIAVLLRSRQVDIRGISAVAGNTTVENASNNILTLLDVARRTNIPVIVGAAAPLAYPLSYVGAYLHGADGLQGAQRSHDLSALPHNPAEAICAAARRTPTLTLLALGPATNVVLAARSCQADLVRVKIIALNGAKKGGNRTPVAETNTFIDPQATAELLHTGLQVTLVVLDAVEPMTFDTRKVVPMLTKSRDPLARLLAKPLSSYVAAQSSGQSTIFTLPDLAATFYLFDPSLATPKNALVTVGLEDNPWRGSTIIGVTPTELVLMIGSDAELSDLSWRASRGQVQDIPAAMKAIIMRQPANAQVVLGLNQKFDYKAALQRSFTNN